MSGGFDNIKQKVEERTKELGAAFLKDAPSRIRSVRSAKALMVVFGAALAGFGQFVAPPLLPALFSPLLGLLGVTLALIGGLWSLESEENSPQAIEQSRLTMELSREVFEEGRKAIALSDANMRELKASSEKSINEMDDTITLLENELIWWQEMHSVSSAMAEIVEGHLTRDVVTVNQSIQDLLDKMLRNFSGLLDFDPEEFWTISVYYYSPDRNILECVALRSPERDHEMQPHREWGPGEGIVGHSFVTGRECIVEDLGDPLIRQWINIPHNKVHDSDEERYKSMVAIPVRISNITQPWGVVSVTSNIQGKYSVDEGGLSDKSIEPMRFFCHFVGLLATRSYREHARVAELANR